MSYLKVQVTFADQQQNNVAYSVVIILVDYSVILPGSLKQVKMSDAKRPKLVRGVCNLTLLVVCS